MTTLAAPLRAANAARATSPAVEPEGTLLQVDYDHPPRPPEPGRIWHLGNVARNRIHWHTVPQGRVGSRTERSPR